MCLVGLFLELEIIKHEENIGTIDTFQAPRQKYIAKKCCVRIRSKKSMAVFRPFSSFAATKNAKYLCVCVRVRIYFFQPHKNFLEQNC